jgi:hypothetical protein
LSRFEDAARHFESMANEPNNNGNVAQIIAFQLELIGRKGAREHTWSEALKVASKGRRADGSVTSGIAG